jgi:hypothetical protein
MFPIGEYGKESINHIKHFVATIEGATNTSTLKILKISLLE